MNGFRFKYFSANYTKIRTRPLDFADALPAFSDPLRKEYYDDKHSSLDEERFLLAGFSENCVLLITFTQPGPETVRIISARRANKHEEKKYYYGNG
ncbi:hypothetical protein FACS1894130_11790 [Spirochaetia bacterium]|nr:hypothetical protein FACS1894130_11790 [Spirochaetia bacterium]